MAEEFFLGADAGGTAIKYVVTDTTGAVVAKGEVATDPSSIISSLQRLEDAIAPFLKQLKAMGLACAGIIDPVGGSLGRSPNLPGWQDSDLGGIITKVFGGLPVILANDVNGALYGEFTQGAGRGCSNLVMIALGTGVGGGVVLGGQLLVGSHHGAGEIGHTMLDPNGPVCTCGNPGCLEAYAGSVGILRRAREIAGSAEATQNYRDLVADRGPDLTTRDLALLAEQNDPTAAELFTGVGLRLGQAVGNVINILNPDRVIIGGGVAKAGDLILKPCRDSVPRMVLSKEAQGTPVVSAELGSLAAAVGAASLARESFGEGESQG